MITKGWTMIAVTAAILAGVGMTASAEVTPDAFPVIKSMRKTLDRIKTAEYDMTEYMYLSPDAKHYINSEPYNYTECFLEGDTTGVSVYAGMMTDGTFDRAYDGELSYYFLDPLLNIQTNEIDGEVKPRMAYFAHVRALCDYMLDYDKLSVSMSDGGDHWIVEAETEDHPQISFRGGKAYSDPRMPIPTRVHFVTKVDKSTMLPTSTSYLTGMPLQKIEMRVENVKINEADPTKELITSKIPDMPRYPNREFSIERRRVNNEQFKYVYENPLPTDTLRMSDDSQYSLTGTEGKVRVIALMSVNCGVSSSLYPTLNKIREKYAPEEVEVISVLSEGAGEREAIEEYMTKAGLKVPLARDNGRFYKYFAPSKLSPMNIVADREGNRKFLQIGFNNKSEGSIIGAIEKYLNDSEPEGE